MAFDECPPAGVERAHVEAAVRRTSLWAARSRAQERAPGQMGFGIVQGGIDLDLRRRSVEEIVPLGFEGYAVGGLSVGEERAAMLETLSATTELLPEERPRYLMGVGDPIGLIEGIARGIDMFDCVLPTRLGRTGSALVPGGRINLRNAAFAVDQRPLVEGCTCPACDGFSRAYVRHLVTQSEITGLRLLTIHNLHHLLDLVARARAAIPDGRLDDLRREVAGE
jgi:queuine tRNA-ribosyltransferase